MIALALVGTVLLGSLVFFYLNAPEGREDKDGFHETGPTILERWFGKR